MKRVFICLFLLSFFSHANEGIDKALDNFHQAAANANYDKYMGLLTFDAIFLGTDSTERWTKQEFSSFVKEHFSRGNGWLYRPIQRNLTLIKQGESYFFDELLDNENYGRCRGSGVVVNTVNGWKIKQYNLSISVPNAIAKDVVQSIQGYRSTQRKVKF